ncbi:hypothetical protein [Haladaptatus litoreus]|nr:hypothetical protein [Haladaptatus litoreus]
MVLGGFVWGTRNPDGHRRRIEVIIWLFVLGFVLPMLFYATLALFGLSMVEIPFLLIPVVSYGSTLLIAYGVVYGLDYRLFLSKSADSVE